MSGELTFEFDRGEEIFRVRGTGLWTEEQANRHFLELRAAIERHHAAGRRAFVLVDLSLAAVQVANVANEVSDGTQQIYREDDRVALIASTALLGMQMKRAAKVPNFLICASEEEGLAWLRAERGSLRKG